MTVHLRPHHLLCLLTYVGKGYTPGFVANYNVIARRLSQGEDIVIVAGPDDICKPLLAEAEQHCWNDSVTERDRLAARDVATLLGGTATIATGTKLVLDQGVLAQLRLGFAAGDIRTACGGCEWSGLCSAVASGGFDGALVGTGKQVGLP
ncbi:MAG: DUF1284 domain-containing protein [Alphaproteobacteria bacterium]|jgi:uncharacterized protein|nr:DUF1284 domain-containing protein [Alphaproteobacteria bacterium]